MFTRFPFTSPWTLKNIAKKTKRSRPQSLKDLLLLACSRMKFPGVSQPILEMCVIERGAPYFQTELFQRDVPDDIMLHYKEYIFFPMHIGKIEQVSNWIMHSCCLVFFVIAMHSTYERI